MDETTDAPPSVRQTRRYQSRNPAFNPRKVLALAEQGLACPAIAKLEGCNQSTIWRFLDKKKPESLALKRFKDDRANILATMQAHNLEVQAKILESIDDGVISALKPGEKTGMVMALNAQHGTLFDKERLERGQSTTNQSIISTVLDSTVKGLYGQKQELPTKKSKQSHMHATPVSLGASRAETERVTT